MNEATRIEEKRRQNIRDNIAKQRALREADAVQNKAARDARIAEYRAKLGHRPASVAYGLCKRETVLDFIRDGALYSIQEIGDTLGFKQTSVAAMLRDLRKPCYGYHNIETVRIENDHFFRLVPRGISAASVRPASLTGGSGSTPPDSDPPSLETP